MKFSNCLPSLELNTIPPSPAQSPSTTVSTVAYKSLTLIEKMALSPDTKRYGFVSILKLFVRAIVKPRVGILSNFLTHYQFLKRRRVPLDSRASMCFGAYSVNCQIAASTISTDSLFVLARPNVSPSLLKGKRAIHVWQFLVD